MTNSENVVFWRHQIEGYEELVNYNLVTKSDNYNLQVGLKLEEEKATLQFHYNSLIYDEAYILSLGKHFNNTIEALLDEAVIDIENINVLADRENNRLEADNTIKRDLCQIKNQVI